MGIHINKLYTLIDQYNIEEIIREMDYTMTPEELQQAKENPVEPHVFKQLPNEQKYRFN